MTQFYPEGNRIHQEKNDLAFSSLASLSEAMARGEILEAIATLCDSEHNLHLSLGRFHGIIPREEGAIGILEGTVRDIALISRVNRPVSFLIREITERGGEPLLILSRRAAQEKCRDQYLSALRPGDIISAKVSHLEPFGAFLDIGCGIPALLPIDLISVSRIRHPKERFSPGMAIRAIVKTNDNGRITLSFKELLGTWEENVRFFSPGETVGGIIRSVESYGVFVELTPNLAGLAEPKEGVAPSQKASVYIKSILPQRMKIKLIIIDAFDAPQKPAPPRYFFEGSHIRSFCYSPPGAPKRIYTEFL